MFDRVIEDITTLLAPLENPETIPTLLSNNLTVEPILEFSENTFIFNGSPNTLDTSTMLSFSSTTITNNTGCVLCNSMGNGVVTIEYCESYPVTTCKFASSELFPPAAVMV